ncbi:MAG: acylphosphatase [Cyclobacteriaceae bacterium]|nr:MAG: acylphosphatase [Cyclobacteriaceae bacterium]
MKHYTIRVDGRVQGVFFRASTLQKATSLGITGWVRNQPDGSVLISAQGEPEKLKQLIDWCKQGPEYATVTKLDYQESDLANLPSFTIIR